MDEISALETGIYGLAILASSVLSGITGAGGGFIATPLLIFMGLTPAQSVSTGKFNGVSISLASLSGMRRMPRRSKLLIFTIMLIAVVVGVAAPHAIVRIESELYKKILGTLLLILIPVIIIKQVGLVERYTSKKREQQGLVVLLLGFITQAVFSTGMGVLISLTLMSFFGMSAIEANVTKRVSQLLMNIAIILGLLSSGLIIWHVVAVGVVCSAIGGFVGGRLAVKKGNRFIMSIFLGLMFVAATGLLLG